ncbi:hypothetical protein SE17_04345, partial [Kouleothrix aurantiaca]
TAERIYLATKVGGTTPLLYVGGFSSDALQVGIQAFSLTKEAIIGDSYSGVGVLGRMSNYLGTALVAGFDSDTSSNTLPTVAIFRHRSTVATVAGFGVQIGFQGRTTTVNDAEMAYIGSTWTDPANATRTSALTFATVYMGLLAAERLRITGYGYLGLNTTSPAGDLHINVRNQEAANGGLTIGGVTGTYAPTIVLRRSDGSYAAPTNTSNNVEVGRISFFTYSGGAWSEGAYVRGINVTGGEGRVDLAFAQDTGTSYVETMRLVQGRVGIGTIAPNYQLDVQMLGVWPAINVVEMTTSLRRATIGFGLNAAGNTGWIIGQSLGNNTVKDFYLNDVTAAATRLYIDTNGFVGLGGITSSLGATLDIVRSGAVQLRLASTSGSGSTMMAYSTGTTESLYIMVNRTYAAGVFSRIDTSYAAWTLSMGTQDQDTFKIYRMTADGLTNSTLFQIDASGNAETIKGGTIRAVEGTYAAPSGGQGLEIASTGGQGYVQSYNRASSTWRPMNINASSIAFGGAIAWGNFNANGHFYTSGRLYPEGSSAHYVGYWGGSGINISTHLLVQGNVYPGGQGSYYLANAPSVAGLIVYGNLSCYHDIYPGNNNGTGASQNASYYLRGESNNGGLRTNGNLLANGYYAGTYCHMTGGLGTNHYDAICSGGLYSFLFSGLGGYSYTSGGVGYNFGNINGGASGQITGSNGGGFIRWHQDGQIHIASMNTSGTVGIVFYAGLNNVGIGTQQGTNNRLFTKGIDSTSSNNAFLAQNSNAANLLYLRNDGLAWVNQSWTVGSDARMKTAVRDMSQSHRKLHRLRTVEYELHHTGRARKHYGLLAEEVEQIYPELVEEASHNEPGATTMKGIRYGDLIPLLIFEIQQLQAEVAELKKGK